MDGYEIHDGRYIQTRAVTSAADAIVVNAPAVPTQKLWTVIMGLYVPSAAETRTVFWTVVTAAGQTFPVRIPVSIALSPTIPFPLLTEGMELKLWPGDNLRLNRDVATAASTMTIAIRFMETDIPYYSYEEPLKKVASQIFRRASPPSRVGGVVGTSPPPGFGGGGRDRGGRGPEPI